MTPAVHQEIEERAFSPTTAIADVPVGSAAYMRAEMWVFADAPIVDESESHAAAIAVATKVRSLGVSNVEAADLLNIWNRLACDPELIPADLHAAVTRAYANPLMAPTVAVVESVPPAVATPQVATKGRKAPRTAASKLRAALDAVRRGFSVFPIRPYVAPPDGASDEELAEAKKRAKRPAIENWQNLATTDEVQIRKWWKENPNYNIGTPTDGRLVFDIDKTHGGLDTWAALGLQYAFPTTLFTITASGGSHIIYARPDHTSVRNSASEIGPGLDVRADGGLIVLPGSTIDGHQYRWGNDKQPAMAPDEIVALGKARRPKAENAGARLVEEDETALELAWQWLQTHAPTAELGKLKDTAYRVACQLYDYGLSENSCRQYLREWGNTHCSPRLEDDTVVDTARNALRYRGNAVGSKHPAAPGFEPVTIAERQQSAVGIPATVKGWNKPGDLWTIDDKPPALPAGVLPEIVETVALDRAMRLGVEPGAPAAAYVTVLDSLVSAGNRLQMRQRDPDWTVRPILWTAIIGLPGSNKSATINAATSVAGAIESKWRKDFVAADARYREVERRLEKRKGAANTGAGDTTEKVDVDQVFADVEIEKPQFRQKVFNDATTEALAVSLSENPSGVLYHSDELAGWLGGMDAYRAKAGKDRPFWLQAKEGGSLTINRKQSARIVVETCAISILGGIQPEKIKALGLGMTDDGLLQRFAPVLIERTGNGQDIDPVTGLSERLERTALAIVNSEQNGHFRFSPEANVELEEIESFKAREIARADTPPHLQQWLEKLPNEFGRVALVFHFIEWHGSTEGEAAAGAPPPLISRITALRARRYVTEFTYRHARVFYQRDLGRSEMEDHAAWIAGFILAKGKTAIETRDIYRSYHALKGANQRDDIAAAMRVLEMYDWVKPVKSSGGTNTDWLVNPSVHDGRFSAIAKMEKHRRSATRDAIAKEAEVRRAG
jgi:hypothetical protein